MANGNYMLTMICFNWNPDLLAFKAVKGCSRLSDHLNKHENIEATRKTITRLRRSFCEAASRQEADFIRKCLNNIHVPIIHFKYQLDSFNITAFEA